LLIFPYEVYDGAILLTTFTAPPPLKAAAP